MFSYIKCALVLASTILLYSCSSSGDSDKPTKEEPVNCYFGTDIKLTSQESGAVATASYDSDSASYVNDGDISHTNFWSGNVVDDYVEIDLGKPSWIDDISVRSSETFLGREIWRVEVSTDRTQWRRTMVMSSAYYTCSSMSVTPGGDLVECSKLSRIMRGIRYIRLRLTQPDPEKLLDIQVYEIVANGFHMDPRCL